MRKRTAQKNKRRRKGFTLIECVVSIAIFAIMGTMFATFMVSSVRVVNLSITNDKDREALMEAIVAANKSNGQYENADGNNEVTISTRTDNGKIIKLRIDLDSVSEADQPVLRNDKYLDYVTPDGTRYCIYIGNATSGEVTPPAGG